MREHYIVWEYVGDVLERKTWGSNSQAAWHYLETAYRCGHKPWLEWRRLK